MLRFIDIIENGKRLRVDEAADGSAQIVDHPELTVKRLGEHVIEVFRGDKSLGCFHDEDAVWIPQKCATGG